MTYKTILVQLGNDTRARASLACASLLAARFDAHLIGLYVFPGYRLTPPVPMPFGAELAGQIRATLKKEAEALEAVFKEMTDRQPFTSEWRSITTERRPPELVVVENAYAADLVVTSQADPQWRWTEILDFPDALALGTGRPVLVVPHVAPMTALPRVAMVAWNGRKEAARAVSDALPLLRQAEVVNILSVNDGRIRPEGYLPDTEVAAFLARHGIKVDLAEVVAAEATVGEEIRTRVIDRGADLLVMGCYGHSRFREFALGGVTRHMLREMTFPILFSH